MAKLKKQEEILFRISRPYKQSKTLAAQKIVLPATSGMITLLPNRAPIMIGLANGLVEILDNKNNVLEKWFIKGGVADCARNRCAVSSEKVISFDMYTKETAAQKRDAARYDEDKAFYQMIIDTVSK